MDTQIMNALQWRYATKQFDSSKKLSQQQLDTLTEVMRLSPSSLGVQPWKFLVISDPSIREKLKAAAWGQPQITDASHLVVMARRTDVNQQYIDTLIERVADVRSIPTEALAEYKKMIEGSVLNMSEAELSAWTAKQCYIPLGMLLEAAALMNVDACPMEGFDNAQFDEILGLKGQNLSSAVICALGFRSAEDKYADADKARFKKEDVVEFI